VAYADFLIDKNALIRGQDKMDTHEKVVVVCSKTTAFAKSVGGENLFYLRKSWLGNVTEI
jgi:hypothetical protein